MNKIDSSKVLKKIRDEILMSENVIIMGKGKTANYIKQKEEKNFYVSIKQSLIFMKDIIVDLLIITDFAGFCGIDNYLDKVRYIICPYYLHDYTHKSSEKYNWNYTIEYLKKHYFSGEIGFIQIQTDLSMDKKMVTFEVRNSGDFAFDFLKHINYTGNIITYGIGIDNKYHEDYLQFLETINPKYSSHCKWYNKYKEDIKKENGQMNNKEIYKKVNQNMRDKYKKLKIKFL